jgi:coenzyme F420-0:L-glutamate ligase / coenzyme F420-1:gamma-L-glutamate ligase
MRLKASVTKLLERERVCRVATAPPNGPPHVVPVCHVLADGKLYFAAGPGSVKIRNLRANPRAAVTVDVYAEDWGRLAGVMLQGAARLVERGPLFRKVRRLLYAKYPQYPVESALEEADSVIVELSPTGVVSWGVD